jgi:hypothetical protein
MKRLALRLAAVLLAFAIVALVALGNGSDW